MGKYIFKRNILPISAIKYYVSPFKMVYRALEILGIYKTKTDKFNIFCT